MESKPPKTPYAYPKRPRRDPNLDQKSHKIKVICNLRQINLGQEQKNVRQYAIHYEPIIADDNYPLKRKILRQLKSDLQGTFEKFFQAGDTLFVYTKNPPEKVNLETKIDETNYNITFDRSSNIINCRDIKTKEKDHLKIKSFVECLIRNIFLSNNHMVRFSDRSFFDYKDVEIFGHSKSKIWHGFSSAVCITETGLFLRINDKNKLITNKTAYEKILEIAKNLGGNLHSEEVQREICEYFRGKTVIAQYGSYRAYRIGEVSFDKNIENTDFTSVKEGKSVTVNIKNYYKNQYNIDIKNNNQPLLIEEQPKRFNKNEEQVIRYLIPELVYLTGVDELDERDRAEIIAKSKFQPSEKVRKIENGLKYLLKKEKKKIKKNGKEVELRSPDEIREEWGIKIGDNFVEVVANCLEIPNIEFGSGVEKVQLRYGRFKQLRDLRPVNFDKHNCLLIAFNDIVNLARQDCEQMTVAGKNLGVKFELPSLQKIEDSRNKEELIQQLRKINYNDGKEMVIVVLDKKTKHHYPTIKDYLYTQGGITSQFMLHDENPRGGRKKQNLSYYSAVLNQMVVKAKGELFKLPFCPNFSNNPSMIIGIDSSKLKEGTKYVISSTFNRSFNKFYTDYKTGDYNTLNNLIKNSIDNFKNHNNGKKPENIILYREGGNERQVEKLVRTELPVLISYIETGYEENYKPKLTIFNVNKKTDLKFFEKKGNGYGNLPSGAVIDKDVVSPGCFEFYLQCPDVDRGTGTPVHFLCLYNSNENLTANDFEEITFRQSYYYWNWPGPIRVPAALKYAEVANQFSSKNIKGEVIEKLKDSPYYI